MSNYSHLNNTSHKLHRKPPAGVFPNSFGYWRQIFLTFAVVDFACLGIVIQPNFPRNTISKRALKERVAVL